MRARTTRILVGVLCALALLDVFTGWTILNVPVVIACLACSTAAAVIGARKLLLIMACLAAACFAIHAGYSVRTDYEESRWGRLETEKADMALSTALSTLERRFADVSGFVEKASGRDDLAEAFKAGTRREMFSVLAEVSSSAGWREEECGIVASDAGGSIIAWAGRLPDFVGERSAVSESPSVRIARSTTHYWITGVAAVGVEGEHRGSITVFRQLDAVYPDILPHAEATTLSEELTARVGHRVEVRIGEQGALGETVGDRAEVSEEIRLPDGTAVGRVVARGRAFEVERDMLRNQGLFIASLAVLALMALGSMMLGRQIAGPRFEKASGVRILLVLMIVAAVRLGLAVLRDFLKLDALEAFTSLHYATQIPVGILRSPADLMITSLLACVGMGLLVIACAYRWKATAPRGKPRGVDRLPLLILGAMGGVLASGAVLLTGKALERVFGDTSLILTTLSPFAISSTHIVMRIGLFALSAALVLLVVILVGWQVSMMRRVRIGGRITGSPTLLSGFILFILIMLFVAAGSDAAVLLLGAVGFLSAVAMDLTLRKRLAAGPISLAVGLALAASLVQFPYARAQHDVKRREAVESASSQIIARTDVWKVSVLEEALAQVAGNDEITDVLARSRAGQDAFALKLWANSILSKAGVTSGIHLVDPDHEVIGRFSLEDIGDLSEIEGALREARFTGLPLTRVTRGTSGGKDVELYLGVIPFFKGRTYLGSAVISIPYAYGDLESIAGFKPTFFEAIGGGAELEPSFDETVSASLLYDGRIVSTTAVDFEVGKRIQGLESIDRMPAWIEHEVAGAAYASYPVPIAGENQAILLSFPLPSVSDDLVGFAGITVGNVIIAFLIIVIVGVVRGVRHVLKRLRGQAAGRLRWSFASKLALAFVLIAIIPTLILGAASRGFLKARFREIMESKAEEGLSLSKLALERLVGGEATHLAQNPILIDELTAEPSLLGMLVSHDVSSAVIDTAGQTLATFGEPVVPADVLRSVLTEGRSYNFFAMEDGLIAKAAVPVRDVIRPETVRGCAFVSRRVDDGLAHRISSELGKDLNFFGLSSVVASSKRELFVAELMANKISPDAYVECFVSGRELHFTWERVGNIDVVVGYSPLRGYEGNAVGAISIPLVFRKDDVGRRMEWTSTAISYLLVIVIGSIFIFGLLLARRISRPIGELIRGTLRIGSGDLAFTIPKSGDDEIGDLVSSFNKMTVTLAKSRKTLSERKRYIETIIGNVGAGIISTDWKGRIETFNSAAEKMLGIRGRNARGRDAKNLLRRIGASPLAAVLDEVEGEHNMVRKEVDLAQQGAGPATLRAVATEVMGPGGRRMGKVIVFEDVTELIRSKKLIAWSEMARQVAHEIKNPLTPMKLSAQQLLRSHRDGASDFGQVLEDGVATIIEQIESLRRIAVEFSQFSRMPQRRLESTDINQVLEESLAQYERTVGGSIEIRKELSRSLPKPRVDRDELKRVFFNIIENAIQAMPAGGTLHIRSARGDQRREKTTYGFRVSSRGAYDDGLRSYVEVSFADTGGGISPNDSERLFEPNFSTKTQGSGLGLAICKGVMDGYNGEIVIESALGAGTLVRVRIPIERGEKGTALSFPRRRPRKAGRHPRRERKRPDRRHTQ